MPHTYEYILGGVICNLSFETIRGFSCDSLFSYKNPTECSLNIVFFRENFVIFLNSASSAAALVFYLPGVCTHTDTERKESPEYF